MSLVWLVVSGLRFEFERFVCSISPPPPLLFFTSPRYFLFSFFGDLSAFHCINLVSGFSSFFFLHFGGAVL